VIRTVVSNALAAKVPAKITFAPGATYRIEVDATLPQGHREARFHLLELFGARDLLVEGNGAKVILTRPTMGLAMLSACTNVQLGGFRLDYDPVTYLSAVILSTDGARVVVKPDAGGPAWDGPLVKYHWSFMGILDAKHPGRLFPGAPNLFPAPKEVALSADGNATLTMTTAPLSPYLAPGNRLVQWVRDRGVEMTEARACSNIVWYDTINFACPAGHYLSLDGSDFKVLHCDSVLSSGRWVSGNADGVHTRANVIGPWMEGCHFEAFGDDGVAIYNKGMFILDAPDLSTVRVSNSLFLLEPGDRFVVFNPREGALEGGMRECLSVSPLKNDGIGAHYAVAFRPPLEKAPTVEKDPTRSDQLFNRSRANALFMVRGNRIRNIRRYGTVVRGINGVIENNLYEGCSSAGVMVRNEASTWRNGLYSEGILIRSNTFIDTAFDSGGEGAIVARFESLAGTVKRPVHQHLTIEGNRISRWNQSAIKAEAVGSLVIRGNLIEGRGDAFPDDISLPVALRLTGCTGVQLIGNKIEGEKPLAGALVVDACAAVESNGNQFRFRPIASASGLILFAEGEACERTGAWSASGLKGYGGKATFWTATSGASAKWTAAVSGKKQILFWRVAYTGNDAAVTVIVYHEGGEARVVLDTRGDKPGWVDLGTYGFKGSAQVRLEKTGEPGNFRISALRFAEVSPK
jgi:hypothetical protein